MKSIFLVLILFSLVSCSTSSKKESISRVPASELIEPIGQRGFLRHRISEGLTYYYLSAPDRSAPLLVLIGGSGCEAVFWKGDDGFIYSDLSGIAAQWSNQRVSILSIEKPGVETFERSSNPGNTATCSDRFKRTFTMPLWIQTIKSAITEVTRRYALTPRKVIAMGHSEGADTSALLAGEDSRVTHAIISAGGGGSPLFFNLQNALAHAAGDERLETSYMNDIIQQWKAAMSKPIHEPTILWGHSTAYWRSRMQMPVTESLIKSRAKSYIVYGTKDTSSPSVGNELLISELVVQNKDVHFRRIPGADHGFKVGQREMFEEVLHESFDWALQN